MSTTPTRSHALVIGGGLAGLVAAAEIIAAGKSVTISVSATIRNSSRSAA